MYREIQSRIPRESLMGKVELLAVGKLFEADSARVLNNKLFLGEAALQLSA
jgi:hypothetical protein